MGRLGHRAGLDGLRGCAILLVVAVHAGLLGQVLGVDFFFVLSGFLITTLLLEEHGTAGTVSLRAFYIRRAARLMPALWLLLAAYVLWAATSGGALGSPTHVAGAAAIGAGFVANGFAMTWSPLQAQYLTHLWSLATEEQFYLLWPVLLAALLRLRCSTRGFLAGLGAVVALVTLERWVLAAGGASSGRIAFGPDTNLDALTIGCAAAFARCRLRWAPSARVATAAAVAALGAGVAAPERTGCARGAVPPFAAPLFPLACAVVIVFVACGGGSLAVRALSVRPLGAVGRLSYGIYLWHLPLMHAAGVAVGLALTAVAAFASSRYVEAPARRVGRRWAGRSRAPEPQPGGRVGPQYASP